MNSPLKKIVLVSLLTFWASITIILALGLYDSRNNGPTANQGNNTQTQNAILTANVVAQHNTPDNCWVIINNKIYGLSNYLNLHPGNVNTITPYCGKDGTTAFDTKDKSKPQSHSQYTDSLLADYYIGDFNKTPNNGTSPTAPGVINNPDSAQKPAGQNNPSGTTGINLTIAVIATHNTPDDCWVIINNKVYSLSNYLNLHPGNVNTITPYCGKDGTTAFDTKDKSRPQSHSQYADSLLADYLIGGLNATVTNQVIKNTTNAATNPPVNQWHEYEDD
jgi:cytochrome b involved in lipid metabolism